MRKFWVIILTICMFSYVNMPVFADSAYGDTYNGRSPIHFIIPWDIDRENKNHDRVKTASFWGNGWITNSVYLSQGLPLWNIENHKDFNYKPVIYYSSWIYDYYKEKYIPPYIRWKNTPAPGSYNEKEIIQNWYKSRKLIIWRTDYLWRYMILLKETKIWIKIHNQLANFKKQEGYLPFYDLLRYKNMLVIAMKLAETKEWDFRFVEDFKLSVGNMLNEYYVNDFNINFYYPVKITFFWDQNLPNFKGDKKGRVRNVIEWKNIFFDDKWDVFDTKEWVSLLKRQKELEKKIKKGFDTVLDRWQIDYTKTTWISVVSLVPQPFFMVEEEWQKWKRLCDWYFNKEDFFVYNWLCIYQLNDKDKVEITYKDWVLHWEYKKYKDWLLVGVVNYNNWKVVSITTNRYWPDSWKLSISNFDNKGPFIGLEWFVYFPPIMWEEIYNSDGYLFY